MKQKYCCVFVSGDIGRSPRMQNHAQEIVRQTNYNVILTGFYENQVHQRILHNNRIQIMKLTVLQNILKLMQKYIPIRMVYLVIRILVESFFLFFQFMFLMKHKIDFILIQNPPSIPCLPIIYLVCKLKGIHLIVDFHNYGFTILQLTVSNKWIIKIAKYIELYFGQLSDHSLCVSQGMQKDLKDKNIKAEVVYDKANSEVFMKLENEQKQEVLQRLGIVKKDEKKTIIVSGTSWTPDEDFQILLDAMIDYDNYTQQQTKVNKDINRVHVVITGKGPLKEYYRLKIEEQNMKYIECSLLWLKAEDYPLLLGSADLGVSLHKSSSGVDLPMKVIDMFGSLLPVLQVQYPVVGELVSQERGWLFQDRHSLFQLFKDIINRPDRSTLFKQKIESIQKWRQHSFEQEWRNKVYPIIDSIDKNRKISWLSLIIYCLIGITISLLMYK